MNSNCVVFMIAFVPLGAALQPLGSEAPASQPSAAAAQGVQVCPLVSKEEVTKHLPWGAALVGGAHAYECDAQLEALGDGRTWHAEPGDVLAVDLDGWSAPKS